MVKVKPLTSKIMTAPQLRKRILEVLRKCRKQSRKPSWQYGMTDEEFIEEVLDPLETDIFQDIEMEKIIRENKK